MISHATTRAVSANARVTARKDVDNRAQRQARVTTSRGKRTVETRANASEIDAINENFASQTPLQIMDAALEKFGDGLAIAFSGAEDVALIQYAALTNLPFRVFSLDTGRLNPETYALFDKVEKHF